MPIEKKTTEKKTAKPAPMPDRKRFARYFRELSVVVIGVAVTFIVSGLVSRWNEKSEMRRYLASIRSELEDNLTEVRKFEDYYADTERFARYLQAHNPQTVSADTVHLLNRRMIDKEGNIRPDSSWDYRKEGPLTNHFVIPRLRETALRMLESSGLITLIGDKQLYRSILDTYISLSEAAQLNADYMNRKTNELYRLTIQNREMGLDILDPRFVEYYYFMAFTYDMEMMFRECAEQIEETLRLLEKKRP